MSAESWTNLSACERQRTLEADICVIGAGAAGIYLTVQLAKLGHSVVLLEAGSNTCADSSTVGFDSIFEGSSYPAATAGRFFGMGGSTSRWGGVLVPHTKHDLRDGAFKDVWTHIVDTVAEMAPRVLTQLGYGNGWDFEEVADRVLGESGGSVSGSGIDAQASLALPFRRKNFVHLLDHASGCAAIPNVFFNAVAKEWLVAADEKGTSRIVGVHAVSPNKNSMKVCAGKFVLTAGTIESARILLEINERGPQPVLRPTSATGCYLADHLSVAIADVETRSLGCAVNVFAPRFSSSWMRRIRLLEVAPPAHSARAFLHVLFSDNSPGFSVAREVLAAIQGHRMPSLTAASAAAAVTDLMRLAYGRFVDSVLYIPKGTPAHLQMDMEQSAARANRVTLAKQKDAYGRPMTRIHWQVTDGDMKNLAETAGRFLSKWPGSRMGMPQLRPRSIQMDGGKPHDAYHPVGTCRMGEDPEAVVDQNLKVWGLNNLWVASTGVLPSAGTANPTFSLLCLCQRLALHLNAER